MCPSYRALLDRDAGVPRIEAVLAAAPLRVRPIVMTVLTTTVGMLPLALNHAEGGERTGRPRRRLLTDPRDDEGRGKGRALREASPDTSVPPRTVHASLRSAWAAKL